VIAKAAPSTRHAGSHLPAEPWGGWLTAQPPWVDAAKVCLLPECTQAYGPARPQGLPCHTAASLEDTVVHSRRTRSAGRLRANFVRKRRRWVI